MDGKRSLVIFFMSAADICCPRAVHYRRQPRSTEPLGNYFAKHGDGAHVIHCGPPSRIALCRSECRQLSPVFVGYPPTAVGWSATAKAQLRWWAVFDAGVADAAGGGISVSAPVLRSASAAGRLRFTVRGSAWFDSHPPQWHLIRCDRRGETHGETPSCDPHGEMPMVGPPW